MVCGHVLTVCEDDLLQTVRGISQGHRDVLIDGLPCKDYGVF